MFIFDVGTKQPGFNILNIYNYDIPTFIIFLSCFLIILIFLRQVFFNIEIFERLKFVDLKIVRILLLLTIAYGLIFEIMYFKQLLGKADTASITADFFCLSFTLLLFIIVIHPNGQKRKVELNGTTKEKYWL